MAIMVKDKVRDKALEKAAESIDALAERAKEALYDLAEGVRTVGDLGDGAWRLAERARKEAGEVAGELYARGQQTAVAVGRRVEEQPWTALAVIGVFGLVLGYALRRG
jgi:ElaB/YqjD/DUF883 family membrane-anchored ribosome-binding protein